MAKGYHDGEMLKRIYLLALFFGIASMCQARQRAWGFCERGGQKVTTAGIPSTTNVQASYPQCNVTVYLTGTQTPATLFSDNSGTALGNPFTANTLGYWFFYADDGRYDIQISGGGLPAPFTFGDYNLSSGGGGGSGITQLSGDGVAGPGSGAQVLTLTSVNASVGTCGDSTHVPQVVLNAKGLATSCTPVAISSTVVIEGAGTPNAGGTNPTTCPTQTGGILTLYRDTSDPDLAIWRCKTAGTPGVWRLQLDSDGTGGTSLGFTEGPVCTPELNVDRICANDSQHRFEMTNNNGTADVVVGANTTDILLGKTFDTAGAGNSLSIAGVPVTGNSGTGAICRVTGSACGGGSSYDPTDMTVEEFTTWQVISGYSPAMRTSDQTSSACGGTGPIAASGQDPVGQSLQTGATSTNWCMVFYALTDSGLGARFPDYVSTANFRPFTFKVRLDPTSTANVVVRIGAFSAVSASPQGVYLEYDSSVSANWRCVVNDGSATATGTGVAATTTRTTFEVSAASAGTLTCKVGATSVTAVDTFVAATFWGWQITTLTAATKAFEANSP